jgi:hypothetical protein
MSETTRSGWQPVFFAATAYRTRFAPGKNESGPDSIESRGAYRKTSVKLA